MIDRDELGLAPREVARTRSAFANAALLLFAGSLFALVVYAESREKERQRCHPPEGGPPVSCAKDSSAAAVTRPAKGALAPEER